MNKIAMAMAVGCICLLSGCAATKGKIEKHGIITIDGYEFSYCNKANAGFELRKDGRVLLCGYLIEELMAIDGALYTNLTFSGGAPLRHDVSLFKDASPIKLFGDSLLQMYPVDDMDDTEEAR